MNITLEQLKEIAKAGYEGDSFVLSHMDKAELYTIDNEPNVIVLMLYDDVLLMVDKSDMSLMLDSSGWDRLAAIRKMEELGLIEK